MSDILKPTTLATMRRLARRLGKARSITHAKALDLVAHQAGYENYAHAKRTLAPASQVAAKVADIAPPLPAVAQLADLFDLLPRGPATASQRHTDERRRELRVRQVLARAQAGQFLFLGLTSRRRFDEFFDSQFVAEFDVLDDRRIKARKSQIWAQVRAYGAVLEDYRTLEQFSATAYAAEQAVTFERRADVSFGVLDILDRAATERQAMTVQADLALSLRYFDHAADLERRTRPIAERLATSAFDQSISAATKLAMAEMDRVDRYDRMLSQAGLR